MGQEDTYIVEEVVDKRINKGKPEYFVKWEGFPFSQNTWEPKINLEKNCLDMIEEFERRQNQALNGARRVRCMTTSPRISLTPNTSLNTSNLNTSSTKKRGRPASKDLKTQSASKSKKLAGVTLNDWEEKASNGTSSGRKSEKHGFDRKLKAKKIVGAVENDGMYCFLMRWEGCEETDIVPAKEAHKICPQLVIQFYEKRIRWKSIS